MYALAQLVGFLAVALVMAVLSWGKALAAPMSFRDDPASCTVSAAGDIVPGTARRFAAEARKVQGGGVAGTVDGDGAARRPCTVLLASLGGDAHEAVKLGREIRRRRMDTRVLWGDECYSECVLAFLGGVERFSSGSDIGIGRLHTGTGRRADDWYQVGNEALSVWMDVADWLHEVGVSPLVLSIAASMPPDRIMLLPDTLRLALHVTNDPTLPVVTVADDRKARREDEGECG